mmetsp:Transcript_4461/g.7181  ORF Transcript_4461/g.7181 Transcript_4461/m.7181 type:complete len:207 (-) Transcript_4461:1370-1990(-)
MEPVFEDSDNLHFRKLSGSPSKKAAGAGLAITFAKKIAELAGTPDLKVGLVPFAVGGTSIDPWLPDEVLYTGMLERVQLARDSCEAPVVGMLWYQGESDSVDEVRAAAYGDRLGQFVNGVREGVTSDLPIVLCAITGNEDRVPYKNQVRKHQFEAENIHENLRVFDTAGMELQDDGLHLTGNALIQLGADLARCAMDFEPIKSQLN